MSPTVTSRFSLFANLGVMTIPRDYNGATRLDVFRERLQGRYYFWENPIKDDNFRPSYTPIPREKFLVRIFQNRSLLTTSRERLEFLKKRGATLLGAQGISLVWERKSLALRRCYDLAIPHHFVSFDEEEYLPEGVDGHRLAPTFLWLKYGPLDFGFTLKCFGDVWYHHHAFFCFTKVA